MKQRVLMRRVAQIAATVAFSFASLVPLQESQAQKKQASCSLIGDGIAKTRSNGTKIEIFGLFNDGEYVREMKCEDRKVVVLTTESLVIVTEKKDEKNADHVRYGLADIYQRDLVSYALDDDRAFFLTKDRTLTVLPYKNGAKNAKAYGYDTDVSKTKLAVQNNFLFLAPLDGKISYCSFDGGISCKSKPLDRKGSENDEFFRNNGILHFGQRKGKFVRITMGATLGEIKIE